MTEYVHIKNATAQELVYHCSSSDRPWAEVYNILKGVSIQERYYIWSTKWYEKMDCGVKMTIGNVFIQRDRADLIARPCKQCFREDYGFGEAS